MPRANPKERITDRLFGGRAKKEQPTFESKLKEEHTKYFERAAKRGPGTYSSEETGAKPLARRRLEYYVREGEKEIKKQRIKRRADRMA